MYRQGARGPPGPPARAFSLSPRPMVERPANLAISTWCWPCSRDAEGFARSREVVHSIDGYRARVVQVARDALARPPAAVAACHCWRSARTAPSHRALPPVEDVGQRCDPALRPAVQVQGMRQHRGGRQRLGSASPARRARVDYSGGELPSDGRKELPKSNWSRNAYGALASGLPLRNASSSALTRSATMASPFWLQWPSSLR